MKTFRDLALITLAFAASLQPAQGIEPGKTFRDCAECPEMVALPPGEFMMGSPESEPERNSSESPQHKVSIAYPLAVGKFAVTFAEWDACVAARGCSHTPKGAAGWGRGQRPVIYVSWNDAQEYVSWLARKTGKPYRLLSEAEWEYAARAGTTTSFYTGQCISTEQANYDSRYDYNNCGAKTGLYRQKTVEVVGSFKPNRFGLFDMAGNVYQWTQDCWHDNYSGAPGNGSAWVSEKCEYRVLRGGSWFSKPVFLRAAFRLSNSPDYRLISGGFRVAR
jgi:formylglycine-generating enzyme required for sulfatase activity